MAGGGGKATCFYLIVVLGMEEEEGAICVMLSLAQGYFGTSCCASAGTIEHPSFHSPFYSPFPSISSAPTTPARLSPFFLSPSLLQFLQTNPKYWDDEEASDVREAYGEDWEKIAAFTYDGVDYTMVKILEPVLVLAKEDPVRT